MGRGGGRGYADESGYREPRGAEGGTRRVYGGNGDVFTAQTSTEALYGVWASVL